MKPGQQTKGYLIVNLCNGHSHVRTIHRLVLETYVGPCPEGMQCRHLNGNQFDNRFENLCWGTPSENVRDTIQHGTYNNKAMTKRNLSHFEEKVLRVCHHDFGGLSIEEAAKKLECSPQTIKSALKHAKKKAPTLFPILTPQHQAILLMYDKHMSRASIAAALGISKQELHKEIAFLRKHKFLWNRKPDQYDPILDNKVKEKF